jgi:osmotically-inducible protein OsmY
MLNLKKALVTAFAVGSLLCFFSAPAAQAQRPAHSDQDVLTCLNTRVNQIRKMDNGANQVSLSVTNGTAYFTGTVVNASYKNQLMTSAMDCGARTFNVNNLRVSAPVPPAPAAPVARAAHSDQDVLICLNNRVNQIRQMDNGANHISLSVTSGTAYLSGNVVNASYKNQLMTSALDCGARTFNVSNLVVAPGQKSDSDIQTCLNPEVASVLRNLGGPGSTLSVSVRNGDATFTGTIVSANAFGNAAAVSSFNTSGSRCGARNTFVNVKFVAPH